VSIEWCDHNGLKYLYVDHRGQDVAEHLATLAELLRVLETCPLGVRVLIHVDPNGRPDSRFLNEIKHATRDVMAPRDVRAAIIGITGIGFAVVRGINFVGGSRLSAFPTREKALDFLTRE
jgi:hypothetical protein